MRSTNSAVVVLSSAIAAAMVVMGPVPCAASEVRIEHDAKACVRPGGYPLIRARVEAAGAVRSARVLFHSWDSPSWYAVDMKPAPDGNWSAPLPRPTEMVTRIGYFIVATAEGAEGRLPERSELVVDVRSVCDGEFVDTARQGPSVLGLVAGASRDVVGFDLHGVEGFAVDVPVEVPPVSVAASGILPLPVLLPVGTRLRLTTIAPQPGDGPPLRDDASSVTLAPQGDSEAVTLTKDGQKLEGRVVGFDREAYVLSVRGVGRVRVRQRDVRSLELREPGHPAMAVVGGLAGLTGGLVTTLLVCVTADLPCSSGTAWLGMLVGAGLGGAAAGGGSWRPVPLFGDPDRVSLTLAPQMRGVAVGLAVKF
jgi:hypothetical protein